jgi:hypothetical protein
MQTKLDYLKIYEDNKSILKECEYNYERYSIGYSLVIIKLNENIIRKKIHLKQFIRLTDICIKINKEYSMLILLKTDLKIGFNILYNIERKLIKEYQLYNYSSEKVFKSAIITKTHSLEIKEMIKKVLYLVENISKNCLIETEEDI